MTSATVKEQAQSPQVLRMHRNRAIDSRIRGYLAMSAFLDKDEVTWKERKKILVHILVWKMEHGKEDITEGHRPAVLRGGKPRADHSKFRFRDSDQQN